MRGTTQITLAFSLTPVNQHAKREETFVSEVSTKFITFLTPEIVPYLTQTRPSTHGMFAVSTLLVRLMSPHETAREPPRGPMRPHDASYRWPHESQISWLHRKTAHEKPYGNPLGLAGIHPGAHAPHGASWGLIPPGIQHHWYGS